MAAIPTFGLIAEGPTDQRVLSNLLIGYFNDPDAKSSIRPLQPILDATDTPGYGGWPLVLDYLQSKELRDAITELDFLIVQIDTDHLHEQPFDLQKLDATGRQVSPEAVIERTVEKLNDFISNALGVDFLPQYGSRIIFAIAVDEAECWLLPLYFTDKTRSATNNCTYKIEELLRKQNEPPLDKSPRRYDEVSKGFRKKAILKSCYDKNISLRIFIENLEKHLASNVADEPA